LLLLSTVVACGLRQARTQTAGRRPTRSL